MHQQRSLSPIPRSQGWACGPSACICVCACFSFVLLVLVAFALLVFFYPCFMRVGGLINNIRGWALECVSGFLSGGGRGGAFAPPRLTRPPLELADLYHVERAMPPHQITYCRFAPPWPKS